MNNTLYRRNQNKLQLQRQREAGFTLIELALVIVIAGVLMSFLGTAFSAYLENNKIKTTKFRIERVQQALEQYLSINGNYPCVAPRSLGAKDDDFGRLINDNCTVAGTGTVLSGGVHIGAIPVRTLSLSDEFIADAWGNKFTYAVTATQATKAQYQSDCGNVFIQDGSGNSLVGTDGSAHYVVISHGETGTGAYPLGNSATPPLSCPTSGLDKENCDDNNLFVSTLNNSDVLTADFFDDFVSFKGQTAPIFVIPTDAVMAFNLNTCPDGWDPYTLAEGRFVIGAQAGTKVLNRYNTELSDPLQQANLNLSLGNESEGDQEANIPPYVALLYCQKLPPVIAACTVTSAITSGGGGGSLTAGGGGSLGSSTTLPVSTDGGGSTGGGSSGGGTVLCGHFFNRGILSYNTYEGDRLFAELHVTEVTKRGYRFWAVPLTHYLNQHPNGIIEKIIQPFVVGWAEEMSFRVGYRNKGNWIGKIELTLFYPITYLIGIFSSETKWKNLESEQNIYSMYHLKTDTVEKNNVFHQTNK